MKGSIRRAGTVVLLSVAVAWGGALAAGWTGGAASPVFREDRTERLTDSNMVDAFVGLPLELRIARADLNQNVLSVDLFLPKGVFAQEFVYHDLYELTRFAWSKTSNVDRVLVRVLQQNGQERTDKELLVAMEALRSQAAAGAALTSEANAAERKAYLEGRYRFTYTKRWKDQT